jgi:hypothetical protein
MSKHIIFDYDLYRIDLGDGEWIDILERCPKRVRDKAQAAMIRPKHALNEEGSKAEVELSFNVGEFNRVLRQEMMKAWSFKDKKGDPVPVTPENIDRLDETAADLVLDKINELNPRRSKPEKNAL